MTEFKPNPFKVAWEDLIKKRIVQKIEDDLNYSISNYRVAEIVEKTIDLYKQELEKNKGLKG